MKAKKCVLTLAFCAMAAMFALAANESLMGTWKLNEAKSKLGAGAPKNNTVTYEASGDNIKVTIDGTAPDGSATHSEWTGNIDGKEYPSTGNPNEDTRSYTQVNSRTVHFVSKKGGKVVLSGRLVVSPNGKTRTVTATGTDAQGKKFTITAVYDKQ
jgi:hypothetical protein